MFGAHFSLKNRNSRAARRRKAAIPTNVPVLESRQLMSGNAVVIGFSPTPPTQVFSGTSGDNPFAITTIVPWQVTAVAQNPSTLTIDMPDGSHRVFNNIVGTVSIAIPFQSDFNGSQTLTATLTDPILGGSTSTRTETENTYVTKLSDWLLNPVINPIT